MLIDTTKKDTSTLSKMIFGLNAHFHNSYGLIDSQTVAFANFIDTLHMNIVDHAPDPIEPVYGYIDIPIPNVLGNLGKVKVFVKVFGTFYSDSKCTHEMGHFYHSDSTEFNVERLYAYIHRLTRRST